MVRPFSNKGPYDEMIVESSPVFWECPPPMDFILLNAPQKFIINLNIPYLMMHQNDLVGRHSLL
jgi:hypothetical protein